jgi:predicted ATPase
VERRALTELIGAHRLVTVTGPGGVGKTRLALRVADDVSASFPDGVVFVDLVHLTDPDMVTTAVAEAIGVPERDGTSVAEAVVAWLASSEVLMVVDNCEHVLDGVRAALDVALSSCPGVKVVATSRARLLAPYETVYAVPGLSPGDDGDAVALFMARVAVGPRLAGLDVARAAALCQALDGMALAIELAAARCSSLGLDGLEAGLDERLRFLTAGARVADRHRSLRSAIAWSYDLLGAADRSLLRTISVFVGWFDVDAARAVGGDDAVTVTDGLARLTDQSLLLVDHAVRTRYRALESIRQFGAERLVADGEHDRMRAQHLRWCRAELERLVLADGRNADDAWCAALDRILDDVRAGLAWSTSAGDGAVPLATDLAGVLYLRGRLVEAQRRYAEAAALAPSATERSHLLRLAAGVAASRHVGNDALALLQSAADSAPEPGGSASDLAAMALYMTRNVGIMAAPPPHEDAAALLEAARQASDASERVEAAIATATAHLLAASHAPFAAAADRAVDQCRQAGDDALQSAALDLVCVARLTTNELASAVAVMSSRAEVIAAMPIGPTTGFEHQDYWLMASEVHLAAGHLDTARDCADALAALPFNRSGAHLGLARRLKVDALAGPLPDVAQLGETFRLDWQRAGRPIASNLASTAGAIAMVHGMLGDDDELHRWRDITNTLSSGLTRVFGSSTTAWAPTFEGLLALHHGDLDAATKTLIVHPDDHTFWNSWHRNLWRPWYTAAWVETAVLSGLHDASDRVRHSRPAVTHNQIAATIVDRSNALHLGERELVRRTAARFDALSCPYQRDRSITLHRQMDDATGSPLSHC